MDARIENLKNKIAQLRDKNKTIDTSLDCVQDDNQKDALNNEKANNNNELRKARSEKYELEKLNEDTDYIKRCYQYLRKLGIIKSQHQFCQQYLNKSQHYLSMIICEGRKPAINALYNLIENLNQTYDIFLEYDNKEAVNRNLINLIERGNRILNKRILGYYRRLEEF